MGAFARLRQRLERQSATHYGVADWLPLPKEVWLGPTTGVPSDQLVGQHGQSNSASAVQSREQSCVKRARNHQHMPTRRGPAHWSRRD